MSTKSGGIGPKSEIVANFFHCSGTVLEAAGVLVILAGTFLATFIYFKTFRQNHEEGYKTYRANLGRAILLGLELLVAADIVGTVAIDPSWDKIGLLAVIILIRTFLSFTLEMEINGRFPWQGKSRG